MFRKHALLSLLFMVGHQLLFGQNPVLLVDINIPDRHEAEVNEPGYTPWPLNGEGESITLDGITFTLAGGYGTSWYKAGVQAPYYARLANDALLSGEGVYLVISGLPVGSHSLLTYHNTVGNPENNTYSPMDIFLKGVLVYDNLIQSNRVSSNMDAQTAYLTFEVSEDEDVTIHFTPETDSDATSKLATLCGFELNTPNSLYQALYPIPEHGDEHVETNEGSLTLSWQAAENALSHDVYFGSDKQLVNSATISSAEFLGSQSDTTFEVNALYSMNNYYWRIDEHDTEGNTTKGDTWHFRPRQLAFADAEGYGRYAIGGRGGKVVEVTNLDDDGPGSLREAVTNNIGPRTIVFSVSGIITLESRLVLKDDYVTVAGQTAPGKGICIRQAPFGLSGARDVIVRHMRVRLGSGPTYDGMGMSGSDYSILDHCSISWTIDEAFSSRGGKNISLQRTLISEALNVANHQNYPYGTAHGYAASIGGDIGSFHHNLLAHCAGRNWSLAGGLDGNGLFAGRMDIFNNIVYNWNYRVTDGGAHEVNFVNNYYKTGPGWKTSVNYALNAQYENFPGTQQYYFAGNIMPGVFDESNQEAGRKYSGEPQGYEPWVDEPFFPSQAKIHPAREAYKNVLSDVGATQPIFDDHDVRIIRETIDGAFTYRGSYTNLPGIPDAHTDVGGWEEYPEYVRDADWDSDHDGMPDWWETSQGLDPNSGTNDFSDSNADPDHDGFTNLEDYLSWLAEPHYFLETGKSLDISIPGYFRGFTGKITYSIEETHNAVTEIVNDTLLQYSPSGEGLGSVSIKVEDSSGDIMLKTIGVFTGIVPADSSMTSDPGGTGILPDLENNKHSFSCYPNPSSDNIIVQGKFNIGSEYEIKIYSITGELVSLHKYSKAVLKNSISLDLSSIQSGVYMISILSESSHEQLKFLKH